MRILKIIIKWSVAALIIVLYLFTLLAPYIHPRHSEVLYFSGLAFPVVTGVFAILCIFLALKYKQFIILLALVPGLIASLKVVSLGRSQADQTASLEVYTFNARTGDAFEAHASDIDAWKAYVGKPAHRPDILCVQERPPKYHDFMPSDLLAHQHGPTSSHLLMRTASPMMATGELKDGDDVRYAIYADLLHDGDTLRMYTFHLSSNRVTDILDGSVDGSWVLKLLRQLGPMRRLIYKGALRRADQAERLHQHMASSPHPVIVAGDMNETCQSYAYQQIKGRRTDAFNAATFGLHPTFLGNPSWVRIDYIFVDPALRVLRSEVLPFKLSDHAILRASVSKREE